MSNLEKIEIENSTLDFSRIVAYKFMTSKTYHNLKEVRSNYLYFLIDTKEIYRGSICFTDSIIKCRTLPLDPTRGKIYYNITTKQMMYYDGDEEKWLSLLTPIVNSFEEALDLGTVTITAKGIKDYIDTKIQELYDSLGKQPGYNTTPIFTTYEAAMKYAESSPLAKAGQCITAPATRDENELVMYVIQKDGSLKEYPSMSQMEKLLEWRNE